MTTSICRTLGSQKHTRHLVGIPTISRLNASVETRPAAGMLYHDFDPISVLSPLG